MAFKFLAFVAFVAVAQAGYIAQPAPLAYAKVAAAPIAYAAPVAKIATPVVAKTVVAEQYDPHPQYSYGYDIQDGLTGDSKSQHEQRDGDFVQGSYSLIDADGFRRIVDYTADPVNGFNAIVRREPLTAPVVAKVATPVVAKVAYAAPAPVVAKVAAAPFAYAAPAPVVAKVAAPLAYAAPAPAPFVYHH